MSSTATTPRRTGRRTMDAGVDEVVMAAVAVKRRVQDLVTALARVAKAEGELGESINELARLRDGCTGGGSR